MDDAIRMRKIVEDDLRHAINRDELTLHYQPLFSADGSSVVGVEALVRWPHARQGMINPARFISIAEERLRSSQTGAEQEWALEALGRMRTERAWRAIREYAARSDLSFEARRRAILQLSQSRDSANASFLRELYGRVGGERAAGVGVPVVRRAYA